ncbi:hypothetical protein ACQR10_05715 [Bradyrhizobium sp. HKCCYLRH2060]|uniref:hypothetical protein n=1 Tax=Bradyrhizobium TaxID=374 RepID=UPI0028E66C2A|nr:MULTISPECIES: hypothetical protein [unclassified Bradyrhizobium]
MKRLAIAMGLLMAATDGIALAQSGSGSSAGTGSKSGMPPQAPIGHRQVRPSDLPKAEQTEDNSMSGMTKEDRDLDRKIKGICRGC